MTCQVMGILNLTPDSFSDGGDFTDADAAVFHAETMISEGAACIDIGAESTRPGAQAISHLTEWSRLEPVLQKLAAKGMHRYVSVDTRNTETALRAVKEFDVAWINNVGGVFDDVTMRELCKNKTLNFIAMHMHGTPESMQTSPLKGIDAIDAVDKAFAKYGNTLESCGFLSDNIYYDPGIGFGKDDTANLKLLERVKYFTSCGKKVVIGLSRKGFIGRLTGITEAKKRDGASKLLELTACMLGASVIRTHDVAGLVSLFKILNPKGVAV